MFIAQHKKRTQIVATRHDFGAQNVPKMLLWPEFRLEPRCADPLDLGASGREGRQRKGVGEGKGNEEAERRRTNALYKATEDVAADFDDGSPPQLCCSVQSSPAED